MLVSEDPGVMCDEWKVGGCEGMGGGRRVSGRGRKVRGWLASKLLGTLSIDRCIVCVTTRTCVYIVS